MLRSYPRIARNDVSIVSYASSVSWKSPMDKVGTIHGDLWSEVRNRHSRHLYLMLTQPELGADAWVTHLFSLVHKKVLCGLLTLTVMEFNRPLTTYTRRRQEAAPD